MSVNESVVSGIFNDSNWDAQNHCLFYAHIALSAVFYHRGAACCAYLLLATESRVHITHGRRNKSETDREGDWNWGKSCVSVFCLQKTCSSLPGFTYFLTLLLCNATLSVFLVPEPNQTAAETKKRMENSEWNYLEMMVDDISEAKTNTSCKTMKPCGAHMAFVCL